MKLSDRIYECVCGLKIDRDFNSAVNQLKKYCTASAGYKKLRFDNLLSNNLSIDTFVYI